MTYNPAIHHRRSIRLKGYDYTSPGAYFITICTQGREYFFGDIRHGAMVLTPYGEIAQTQWNAITARFPNVTPGEYAIMPNHFHGIIYIHPTDGANPVRAPLAGALGGSGSRSGATARVAPTIAWTTFAHTAPILPTGPAGQTKTVGDIVGAYKSLVVHGCLQWIKNNNPRQRLGMLWQRNYWEHIVRDEMELNRIREYIRNNLAKWEADRFYGLETGDQIKEDAAVYGEEDWMI